VSAAAFSVIVLGGMELLTFTSVRPRLNELPGVPAQMLQQQGYDVFRLGHATPSLVAADVGADRRSAEQWVNAARLASLRGIGTENLRLLHQVDVRSVEQLATVEPDHLIARIEEATGEDWVDARIRVWVRGAKRTLGAEAATPGSTVR
jgi:hypothetical protein